MESNLAKGVIRIDADISDAKAKLESLNASLNSLVPGANAASQVMHRLAGGMLQLVQGTAALALGSVSSGFREIASAGIEMATTLERTEVALNTLLDPAEDVHGLMVQIKKDAVATPFDVEGLAKGTQQLSLITKNGAEAERTILNLGKAVAAGGGGSAELKRMAINMQQVGLNAQITQRDIKEFGNAGIDILGVVGDYLGKTRAEAQEYLKDISNPYDVLAASLNAAGEAGGRYADIYEQAGGTIGQVTEALKESMGLFADQVLRTSGILDKVKESMATLADAFVDPTFIGTVAESFRKLTSSIDAAGIIERVIKKIQDVLAAFNAGQFDNIVVFFKEFFNTLKQFSGLGFVSNTIKVIMDLFSDNHTAAEVRNVANQLATLLRVFLEFKMVLKLTGYISSFFSVLTSGMQTVMSMGSALQYVGAGFKTLAGAMITHPFVTVTIAILGVVAALKLLNPRAFDQFVQAIADGINNVVKFFKDLAQGFLNVGRNIIVGLWNGLVNGFNAIIGKIQEMGRAIANAFKSALGIHSPSRVMRDEVGIPIDQGIAEGIRKGYGDIVSATEEVKEKLAALQADWVEELSQFGALDLVQQANALRSFQQLYAQGTKARLEMDKQVHNAEIAITKEIINLVDTYNDKFNKAYKAAKEYYNLFEYTQNYLTRDTYSVIEGLQRQNDNLIKYAKNLKAINQMGFDSDFIQTIMDQGLDAASEVAGLADATEEEIEEINRLWRERGAVSTDIAVLNTKKLKDETLDQIDYLQGGLQDRVIDVYDTGTLLDYNFMRGIYDTMPTVADAALEVALAASKGTKKGTDEATESWDGVANVADFAAAQAEEFAGALGRLDIQAFDTADAFSLLKNILGGIPWYIWAGAIGFVGFEVLKLFKNLKQAKEAAEMAKLTKAAMETIVGGTAKTVGQASAQMASDASQSAQVVTESVKKTNMAYSSQGKIGAKILKPFKKFNTFIQGLASSVQQVITSIGDIISTGINTIGNVVMTGINTIFRWLQGILSGIMDLVVTFTGGIGRALQALIEPLSSPELLIGVGVLAGLAASLILFGVAAQTFAAAGFEGALALAGFAVEIGVLAAAASLLAPLAPAIITAAGAITVLAGALAAFGVAMGVAIAAIGVGLDVAAHTLEDASNVASQINLAGLGLLMAGIALSGAILTAMLPFTVIGAVSGAAAAIMGTTLVLAGTTLALASGLGAAINLAGIQNMLLAVMGASTMLTLLLPFAIIGAVAGAVAAVLSVELVAIAGGLAAASALAGIISLENIQKLNDALTQVAGALTGALFIVALGTAAATVAVILSVEVMAIAGALAGASALGGLINLDNLKMITTALNEVAGQLAGAVIIVGFATVATTVATLMSIQLVLIATALALASKAAGLIAVDNMHLITDALHEVANGMGWLPIILPLIAGATTVATFMSVQLMVMATALAVASNEAALIKVQNFDILGEVINKLGQITTGNMFQNLANMANTAIMAQTAENIRNIVGNITQAMTWLAILDQITDGKVDEYRDKVFTIVEKLAQIQAGNPILNSINKEAVAQLDEMTTSIKSIVEKVSDMVHILDDLTSTIQAGDVEEYVAEAIRITEAFGGIELEDGSTGWFSPSTYERVANDTEEIAKTSGEITKIIEETKKIIDILKEFDSMESGAVEGYVKSAIEIMQQFGGIELESGDNGWFSQNTYERVANDTENIKKTTQSISEITTSAKNIVDIIKEFSQIGVPTVKGYVQSAIEIMQQFAEVKIENEDVEKTANSAGNVKTTASNVSEILKTTVEIVESIRKLTQDDLSIAKVQQYIQDANTIMQEFAKIELTQENLETTANNASHVKDMSGHIKEVLKNCQEIVGIIQNFGTAPLTVDIVKGYVGDANSIIAKFSELNLEGNKNYEQLASNVGYLKSIVENVKAILDGAREAINTIDEFCKTFNISDDSADNSVSKKVDAINLALKKIAAIKVETDSDLASESEKLTNVKDILGKVKEVAEAMLAVPEVAEKTTTNINGVIEYIKNSLSQLPQTMASYNDSFKNVGINYADNVIQGWDTKVPEVKTHADNLQREFWQALENKMNDEYEQGKWMATKVLDGIKSKESEFKTVAQNLQGAFWSALEAKMQDEYYQGKAMANKVVSGLQGPDTSYTTVGNQVAQGFAGGINSEMWRVNQAVGNLSSAAIKKLKDLLGIASPSKVFAELGGFVTEGFAEGMEDSIATVEETGELIANALLDGYYDNIRPLTASVDSAVEYNKARDDEAKISRTPTAGRGDVYITQNNNVYDQLDSSKLINDLAWAVQHA